MGWTISAILLVTLGLIALLLGLQPLVEVCRHRTGQQPGWRILFIMVIGFIFGYLLFLFLLFHTEIAFIHTIVGGVFAGGGMFVYLVARMSLSSLNKVQRIAEKYEEQALHDSLTGLPNRKHLFLVLDTTIAAAGRDDDEFAVMVMDLNGFKEVNDTLGHATGDRVLQIIAPRLASQLRSSDTLCRLGGDEFAVVLPKTRDTQAQQVAHKLLKACSEPIAEQNRQLVIGISIGIAVWPQHSRDGAELLQLADIAMYEAKKEGSGSLIYKADEHSLSGDRLALSLKLQQAVTTNELTVFFQPMVSQGRLHAIEALLRWPQSDGSIWLPQNFMPLADQLGLNQQLTEQMLNTAMAKFQQWQKKFSGRLHLNLFLGDVISDNFAELLADCLKKYDIVAERVTLEISEPLFHRNARHLHDHLTLLQNLGVRLSIDDFGSKGAGLMLLRDYPISEIKLDPMFCRELSERTDNQSIVLAAQLFCKKMNIELVIEGVERQQDAQQLQTMDISCYQGFAYCPPLSADDFENWLNQQTHQ